jgi:hypothetical protein
MNAASIGTGGVKKPFIKDQADPGLMAGGNMNQQALVNQMGGGDFKDLSGGVQAAPTGSLNNSSLGVSSDPITMGADPSTGGIKTPTAPATPGGMAGGNMTPPPGGMAGGNMTPPPAAAGGDVPPVPGWVKYGNGGWAPPEIVSQMTPATAAPTPPPAAPPVAPPPVAPPPPAAPPPVTAPPPGPTRQPPQQDAPPDPMRDQFRQALLDQMGKNSADVSMNDPSIKGQADAYAVSQQRAQEAARGDLAERLSQQGLGVTSTGGDSGALTQGLLGLRQQQGENTGQFNAGLVGAELQNRRAQLQQTLQLAGATMSEQDRNALQKQIAEMGADIQKQQMAQQSSQFGQSLAQQQAQMAQQGSQFGQSLSQQQQALELQKLLGIRDLDVRQQQGQGQLGLQDKLGTGGLQLGLLQAMLQNQQFGQGLSSQNAQFGANLNQNALLQMLQGLG